MGANTTQETLALIKAAQPMPFEKNEINKAFSQATGLVNYDLEAGAKLLVPVLTPLRNMIPRVKGNGGNATNWKAITSINPTNQRAGVSEGNRGGIIADAVVDYNAAYKGIGLENTVTFEAEYAAEGFDDARARGMTSVLNAVMIQEESILLGGNNSLALGTSGTPVLAGSSSGGALATQTLSVICVALGVESARVSSVSGGIQLTATRTNADGTTDVVNGGHAAKSTAATVGLTGPTASATATTTVLNGAGAYAWYWGPAGSEVLGAITYINSVAITALATGTQLASAVVAGDKSQDTLVFDGIITQICKPGSGAYVASGATGAAGVGTSFTSDGAGGVTEIENAFQSFWDQYRLSPDVMWVSAKTLNALSKLIIANGGAPLVRYTMDASGGSMTAGTVVANYLNKITNSTVAFKVHPNMPDGAILFYSTGVPYPLSNVSNILQVKTRKEYYATEWPMRSRRYEFGVYADELLQCYFPPAFGLIRNYKV